jgi:hypothetical protein
MALDRRVASLLAMTIRFDRSAPRAPKADHRTEHNMRLTRFLTLLVAIGGSAACADRAFADTTPANDYPTSARADYVFACMKTNGDTREALEQCSCSIDVIASLLPYDAYVAGETVASMNQALGQIGSLFRGAALARQSLADLRRAQAEAEVRCF